MSKRKSVILCANNGKPIGTANILGAHTKGLLHLAFSAYLFRKDRKEILIQKRSRKKMLWPDVWANTCCSHPQSDTDLIKFAEKRLQEEFGFTHPLKEAGAFIYRSEDPAGRGIEHEYDILLIGDATEEIHPDPDPNEIAEWKWIAVDALQKDMQEHPESYAPWFHEGLKKVLNSPSSPQEQESPSL